MIKKLTSEQFMNILEDAQNSISDTKIQVENIKTEIENKMNVINNIEEYNQHRIELLDKKNGSRKPSATQIENEDTKSAILSAMESGKTYTVTDIMKMLGLESNQKASALIRQLKNDGLVERTEVKGRAYFSKVEG